MSVSNILNLQQQYTINNNSIGGITQELFKILKETNESNSEVLSESNKIRIANIFANIFENNNLQNEKTSLTPLIERAIHQAKTEDVRKVFIAFLRKCPDEMIRSVLNLDNWKNSLPKNWLDPSLMTRAETACTRIIECFKKADTKLDLSSLYFSSLPDSAFTYLTHLENLDISANNLTALPKEIFSLTNLKKLNCDSNKLTCLPPEIEKLSALTYLSCGHNKLTSLPKEIGKLSALTHLYCGYNQLSCLPNEIGKLYTLTYLRCDTNELLSLPNEIVNLVCLTELDFSYNSISSFSLENGQLPALIRLNCSYNNLTSLPKEIKKSSSLTYLNCSNNKLLSLPPEIGQLSELQILDCSSNELTQLVKEVGLLLKLQRLNCSKNRIQYLPSEIGQLLSLESLTCCENRLLFLPIEIGQLISLNSFSCRSNKLLFLPEDMGKLSALNNLDCSENQLLSIPVELGQLSKLELFNCSHNKLQKIPDEVASLKIRHFSYQYNFLTTVPSALQSIFSLRFQNQHETSDNNNSNSSFTATNALVAFMKSTQDASLRELNLSFLTISKHPGLFDNVLQWLDKLKNAKEFQNEQTRPLFAAQVLSILKFAKNNPQYLETLKAQLVEALGACSDRAASPINYLKLQKMVLESKEGSIENCVKILKSSMALELLDKFAKEFMKHHLKADEIEVYLGFKIKLKDKLDLPTLESMDFFTCSDITDKDLQMAEDLVRDAWNNLEMLTSYFLLQRTWTDKLKADYKTELNEQVKQVYDKLEKLTEKADQLTTDEYMKEMELLQTEHKNLENEWLSKKTIEILKTSSAQSKQEI